MSVCEVKTSDTWDRGRPLDHGLSDLRMGTMDRQFKCTTCGGGYVLHASATLTRGRASL